MWWWTSACYCFTTSYSHLTRYCWLATWPLYWSQWWAAILRLPKHDALTANEERPSCRLLLLPLSVKGSFFSRIKALLGGGLEWEVESTTVTHSSAETPDRRDQRFYCLIRKTLSSGVNGIAKVPKRIFFFRSGTRTIDRPVAGRRPNPLGHPSLGIVGAFLIVINTEYLSISV